MGGGRSACVPPPMLHLYTGKFYRNLEMGRLGILYRKIQDFQMHVKFAYVCVCGGDQTPSIHVPKVWHQHFEFWFSHMWYFRKIWTNPPFLCRDLYLEEIDLFVPSLALPKLNKVWKCHVPLPSPRGCGVLRKGVGSMKGTLSQPCNGSLYNWSLANRYFFWELCTAGGCVILWIPLGEEKWNINIINK